jgi:hypothetical protein
MHVAADKVVRNGPNSPQRVTPGQFAHAYRELATFTLCGLRVAQLHWVQFPAIEFTDVEPQMCCPTCSEAVARA